MKYLAHYITIIAILTLIGHAIISSSYTAIQQRQYKKQTEAILVLQEKQLNQILKFAAGIEGKRELERGEDNARMTKQLNHVNKILEYVEDIKESE